MLLRTMFAMVLAAAMAVTVVPAALGADRYVATNGAPGAATNWSTAYTNVQDALNAAASGDNIYLAGSNTFSLTNQLAWANTTNVTIRGGYEATNAVGPGSNNPTRWPTVIARNSAYSNRILSVSAVTGVLDGLIFTGGKSVSAGNVYGGGIQISNSVLTLVGCVISNNLVQSGGYFAGGGGLYALNSAVILSNCWVASNLSYNTYGGGADAWGGGLFFEGGQSTLLNTIIRDNRAKRVNASARNRGGGIFFYNQGTNRIRNCVIAGNAIDSGFGFGSGIAVDTAATRLTIENTTIADNTGGDGLHVFAGVVAATNSIFRHMPSPDLNGSVQLAYCDLSDGTSNGVNGCVSMDPLFVDTNYYHLQSKQGHYTNGYFSGGGWTAWNPSGTNSPVIDAGDPSADCTREPAPNGGRVNLGAYANTEVASLTDTATVFTVASVTNLGATLVGHRTARLNGQVTDTGGKVPECGFAYWIADSGLTSSASVGLQNGVFYADVVGLSSGSNYQFQAFASNSAGVGWSDVKSFRTHPAADGLYVATNGNNTAGTNWSTAYTNLPFTLNITESGDTIYLAGSNTVYLNDQLVWANNTNVSFRGGYEATNAVGPGSNNPSRWPTVLLRTNSSRFRILNIANVTNGVLAGLTFTGGYPADGEWGGGIRITNSALTLVGCVISSNQIYKSYWPAPQGGGLYASNSTVILSNCWVAGNKSFQGYTSVGECLAYGGGLFFEGGQSTLLNTIIRANRAQKTVGETFNLKNA